MNPLDIIAKYYPVGSEAYRILVIHSRSVADKALAIARMHPEMNLDLTFVEEAATLHDIGIFRCNAPDIDCHGDAEYICHGYLGAELMRAEGYPRHARVCERHTGTGITLAMIEERGLPLPHRDFMPETLEEQLICYADKFYSKSHPKRVRTIPDTAASLEKFGADSVNIFLNWAKLFEL